MKAKILKLREKGKTYNEIKEILGCSKGTISYHCGEGQKEKYRIRLRKNRKNVHIIIREKIAAFLRTKILNYKRGRPWNKVKSFFNYNTAYKQIFNNPVCYLTGRKIDLSDSKSYHLDHKKPFSKGGKCTFNNLGLACRSANLCKNELCVEEFIKLCIEICEHNGYTISKKNKK